MFLPSLKALIVVSQDDTVRAIADPVHRAQDAPVDQVFTKMVFQQDARARHPRGFTEELSHI